MSNNKPAKKVVKRPVVPRQARVPRAIVAHRNPDASFGLKRDAQFAYGDLFILSDGALNYESQVFKINSMYDPDLTGAGHQPRGFDQLLSSGGPYTRYCVQSCRITAIFQNGVSDTGICGIHWSTDEPTNSDFSSTKDGLERAQTVWKVFNRQNTTNAIVEVSADVDMAKLLGRRTVTEDDDTCGSYNADPAKLVYASVFAINGSLAVTCGVHVKLDFRTRLFGRAQIASS